MSNSVLGRSCPERTLMCNALTLAAVNWGVACVFTWLLTSSSLVYAQSVSDPSTAPSSQAADRTQSATTAERARLSGLCVMNVRKVEELVGVNQWKVDWDKSMVNGRYVQYFNDQRADGTFIGLGTISTAEGQMPAVLASGRFFVFKRPPFAAVLKATGALVRIKLSEPREIWRSPSGASVVVVEGLAGLVVDQKSSSVSGITDGKEIWRCPPWTITTEAYMPAAPIRGGE